MSQTANDAVSPAETDEEYAPGRLEATLTRFGTIGELILMLVRGGRWWMVPMVVVLTLVGLALVLLQSMQYVAPFIYMVF